MAVKGTPVVAAHGVPLKTLKDCLQFLEWLKNRTDVQSSVANRLKRLLEKMYTKVDQRQIESALAQFLNHISTFYHKLCNGAEKIINKPRTAKNALNALFECIPKVLSVMYFFRYHVDEGFKALGGGGWADKGVGVVASYANLGLQLSTYMKFATDIDKYLIEKNYTATYGVIPGGFASDELKPDYQGKYPQGKYMLTDVKNILEKETNKNNLFRDVFSTSVLSKNSGTNTANIANALRLVEDFCRIFERVTKDVEFKNHLQSNRMCINWEELEKHCGKLKGSLGKIFTRGRFSFTGYAREYENLNKENTAKKMATWLKKHLPEMKNNLAQIQFFSSIKHKLNMKRLKSSGLTPSQAPMVATYFTKNFIHYGFTFYFNKYNAKTAPYDILEKDWDSAISELKKPNGDLDQLKTILDGNMCSKKKEREDRGEEGEKEEDEDEEDDEPPDEILEDVESEDLPSPTKTEATKTEAAKPVVTKADSPDDPDKKNEGAQNQGKKAEGAQNQGKKVEGGPNQDYAQSDGNVPSAASPSPDAPGPSSGQDLGDQAATSGAGQQSGQEAQPSRSTNAPNAGTDVDRGGGEGITSNHSVTTSRKDSPRTCPNGKPAIYDRDGKKSFCFPEYKTPVPPKVLRGKSMADIKAMADADTEKRKLEDEEEHQRQQERIKTVHPVVQSSEYYYNNRDPYYNIPPPISSDSHTRSDRERPTLDGVPQEETSQLLNAVVRSRQKDWDQYYLQQQERKMALQKKLYNAYDDHLQDSAIKLAAAESAKQQQLEQKYKNEIHRRVQNISRIPVPPKPPLSITLEPDIVSTLSPMAYITGAETRYISDKHRVSPVAIPNAAAQYGNPVINTPVAVTLDDKIMAESTGVTGNTIKNELHKIKTAHVPDAVSGQVLPNDFEDSSRKREETGIVNTYFQQGTILHGSAIKPHTSKPQTFASWRSPKNSSNPPVSLKKSQGLSKASEVYGMVLEPNQQGKTNVPLHKFKKPHKTLQVQELDGNPYSILMDVDGVDLTKPSTKKVKIVAPQAIPPPVPPVLASGVVVPNTKQHSPSTALISSKPSGLSSTRMDSIDTVQPDEYPVTLFSDISSSVMNNEPNHIKIVQVPDAMNAPMSLPAEPIGYSISDPRDAREAEKQKLQYQYADHDLKNYHDQRAQILADEKDRHAKYLELVIKDDDKEKENRKLLQDVDEKLVVPQSKSDGIDVAAVTLDTLQAGHMGLPIIDSGPAMKLRQDGYVSTTPRAIQPDDYLKEKMALEAETKNVVNGGIQISVKQPYVTELHDNPNHFDIQIDVAQRPFQDLVHNIDLDDPYANTADILKDELKPAGDKGFSGMPNTNFDLDFAPKRIGLEGYEDPGMPRDSPRKADERVINPFSTDECQNPWSVDTSSTDTPPPPASALPPTDHLPPPKTVREMLHWFVGLSQYGLIGVVTEHVKGFLKGYNTDAFEVTGDSDQLTASHVAAKLTEACLYSATVIYKVRHNNDFKAFSTFDFKSEYSKFCYSPDPAGLLCQLRDYVYACHHQLEFLKAQSSRDKLSGGWENYEYGSDITASKSPLQAFLTDDWGSTFETHPFDPCNLCLKSRVRMGFKKTDLPISQQNGNTLSTILTPSCGGEDPLLTLCSYLNCFTRRTPRTIGELVSYFHHFGIELHNYDQKALSSLGTALSTPHAYCPDWDCLGASDFQAARRIRGSESLNATHDHLKSLPKQFGDNLGHLHRHPQLLPTTYHSHALYLLVFEYTIFHFLNVLPCSQLFRLPRRPTSSTSRQYSFTGRGYSYLATTSTASMTPWANIVTS
ncbi:hypothetical protein BBBOND_0201130 [Babesia bigemina]|uniref:Ribosome-binding protein 1 n=1 Tax=Babesia bigemina TaxID=5866 RepID=A0A061D2G0_BABBI|nr:hypothetical protein BBBOND_0201130 [Babesia bigemina]CDR94956.1 hypothetical protein BBBOND_0201130 [Babesia bigemina]|eukprot:XP_012767142.1 hypothetical protein BBBOND_0201130 [Babesia bigemina]